MVSVLHADGTPWAGDAERPGSCLPRARRRKEMKYPEFDRCDTARLVVAAAEIGGRMNKKSLDLIEAAASLRAQQDPPVLRRQAVQMWRARGPGH